MNYQEKQNLKLERYKRLQDKAERESQDTYNKSTKLSETIPFGQPILIGHHSEARHRNHIKKIHSAMDNSIKLQEKAEYYKNKVDNILNSNSISSDNPEALNLLKEKLKGLESKREKIKEFNKKAREEKKPQANGYILSNLSQNIRSVKERIKGLENLKSIPEEEKTINNITLKTDKEENRIKLFFPSMPNQDIRNNLKRNGFKWSRYNGCWQRQLNNTSLYLAEKIIKECV